MSESTFTVSTEVFIAVNTPFIMGPALKNSPLMNGMKKLGNTFSFKNFLILLKKLKGTHYNLSDTIQHS